MLGQEVPDDPWGPLKDGTVTFIAFLVFGSIPLWAYVLAAYAGACAERECRAGETRRRDFRERRGRAVRACARCTRASPTPATVLTPRSATRVFPASPRRQVQQHRRHLRHCGRVYRAVAVRARLGAGPDHADVSAPHPARRTSRRARARARRGRARHPQRLRLVVSASRVAQTTRSPRESALRVTHRGPPPAPLFRSNRAKAGTLMMINGSLAAVAAYLLGWGITKAIGNGTDETCL